MGERAVRRDASVVESDPFWRLSKLDKRMERVALIAAVIALGAHTAVAGAMVLASSGMFSWASRVRTQLHDKRVVEIEIEMQREEPPPPQPSQPALPEPASARPVAPARRAAVPAAAAQTAAVLTRQVDPNEPVDLTNTFVTGGASSYAGGVSERGGTSAIAVRDANARAFGVGVGPVDRSRPARLADSTEWQCPWPAEAEAEQIDDASILVRVRVSATGEPTTVEVVNDPGHGFAREARRCAMRKRYLPALDSAGNPVVGGTNSLNIHFAR